jgi:hypothetical protein
MSFSPISYVYSYLAGARTITGEFPIYGLSEDYRCKKPQIQKEILSDSFLLDEGVFVLLWPQESSPEEQTYFIADVEGLVFELNT